MPNLPAQTVVAQQGCDCCSKPVQVKLNKNGNAYYNCNFPRNNTGNNCSGHRRWGRDDSQAMQTAYLASRKQTKLENQDEQPTESAADERDRGTDTGVQEQPPADDRDGPTGVGFF